MKELSHINQERIIDSLQVRLSDEEQREFDLWLDDSENNKSEYETLKKIWKYTSHTDKEYDVEAALEKVNSKIASLESNSIITKRQNWFSRHKTHLMSAAAVFIMGLILSFAFFGKDHSTIYLAENSDKTIELPDGSEIILSKDASLSYKRGFNTKERKVEFSGQAHFDIASNPNKPFIIKANNMIVEVLGTEFDIDATKNSEKYIVNLFSGKVKMYSIDNEGNQQEQIILLPGERGIYDNATHRLERKYQASSNNSVSSEHKILDFNNVTLLTVAESLSEAYDIEIYLDEKFHNLRITARFENETLESIFNTMAAIFDMQIVRIGNTVTIR